MDTHAKFYLNNKSSFWVNLLTIKLTDGIIGLAGSNLQKWRGFSYYMFTQSIITQNY